jgi:hypothetical protein
VLFVSATAIPVQVLLTGYSLPFSSHCLFFFFNSDGKVILLSVHVKGFSFIILCFDLFVYQEVLKMLLQMVLVLL